MVRLKEELRDRHHRPQPRFNSIVVRLKGHKSFGGSRNNTMFQFHSGSIKSDQGSDGRDDRRHVSIP